MVLKGSMIINEEIIVIRWMFEILGFNTIIISIMVQLVTKHFPANCYISNGYLES